jgi:hypothetical protein
MHRDPHGYSPLLLTVPLVVALVSGCAIGVTHHYHDSIADLQATGAGVLAVAVQDARPYVVSGNKAPSFVGLSRGGYGNPFNVNTETGRPLAADIADSVCQSLQRKGFGCSVLETQPKDTTDDAAMRTRAVEAANRRNATRVLFLVLNEWKSDTYQNTALLYDVVLVVLKPDGSTAATEHIQGRDNLGGSFWNPPGHSSQAVPIAFKAKIEQLLNSPKIVESMRSP